jgi:hypothetical protein
MIGVPLERERRVAARLLGRYSANRFDFFNQFVAINCAVIL